MLAHNPAFKLAGFTEIGQSTDTIEVPDLRSTVQARHAVTSKNVQGWRPDQRPASNYPERPAASTFTDSLARETFDVGRLVDSPNSADLKTAITNARSK